MENLIKLILSLCFTLVSLHGEVLPYEQKYIHFDVPEGWVRQAEKVQGMGYYFKWQEPEKKLFYQIHRHRKWAQWHLKGLSGKQSIFIDEWKKDLDLRVTGEPFELQYDPENYILKILWQKENGFLISKMKLTAFGCLAFHQYIKDESELLASENLIGGVLMSMKIPETLQFYPEDLASELMNNMGGAIIFVILSILYLMFSLFQRSQQKHRRLEMLYASRMTSDH